MSYGWGWIVIHPHKIKKIITTKLFKLYWALNLNFMASTVQSCIPSIYRDALTFHFCTLLYSFLIHGNHSWTPQCLSFHIIIESINLSPLTTPSSVSDVHNEGSPCLKKIGLFKRAARANRSHCSLKKIQCAICTFLSKKTHRFPTKRANSQPCL